MKSICLRDHEVRGLLDGTVSLIVRPAGHDPQYTFRPNAKSLSHDLDTWDRGGGIFGLPGERLLVREAFCYSATSGYDAPTDGRWAEDDGTPCPIWYMASDAGQCEGPWRSPATMPRWASRLVIETVSVRVGPVRGITVDEAIAAGWPRHRELFSLVNTIDKAAAWFCRNRWEPNYGKRYPWGSSFAWFATVKRVEAEG